MKHILFFAVLFVAFTAVSAQEIQISKKYQLVKLEGAINTRHDDAAPVVSPDGKTLYFFINNHPENRYGTEGSQDIWVSRLDDSGVWGPAEHMGSPLNANRGNQVFSVLNNGNTLFIRGGSKKDSRGFSIVNRSGRSWGMPTEIKVEGFEEMNKNRFYGATMSADMEFIIIYFSDNPRMVRSDLYLSKRMTPKKYSMPVKLKGGINTGWDEFGPFLSPDNQSLYFASDRKGGLGGADLYVSHRTDDSWINWSEPENLGAPINTTQFDGYISIDASGNIFVAMAGKKIDGGNLDLIHAVPKDIHYRIEGKVVDSSTGETLFTQVLLREGGNWADTLVSGTSGFKSSLPGEGNFVASASKEGYNPGRIEFSLADVYNDTTVMVEIPLSPERKAMQVVGTAYDSKTGEVLPGVEISISMSGSEQVEKRVNAPEGTFSTEIENEGSYTIEGTKPDYLAGNAEFSVSQDDNSTSVDVYLDPIEVGTTVVLENIYFDFDKSTLKSESFIELDKVYDFLTTNASLKIEIGGHTDAKGNDDYNRRLSQGRAEAVVNYLIDKGVSADRLVPMGYGEAKPIETNETDEGRAKNRRVEFVVLEI